MSSAAGPTRPHLVEVALAWPPETFLQWKLTRLASRGYRVTVVSAVDRGPQPELPGVSLKRVAPYRRRPLRDLSSSMLGLAALLLTRPARVRPLLDGFRAPLVEPRRPGFWSALRRFRAQAGLARLDPAVAHFEWESAAVAHLPLFDVWRCPVVVSCHGSGINVHPHTGEYEHWVRGYPAIFAKAAAIHCVSEAIGREVLHHGADPGKVHVIRPAVDAELFRPRHGTRDEPSELRIVGVGDLNWIKGHLYALQAIRELVDRGVAVRYDILGGAPPSATGQESQLGQLLFTRHDLGLDDVVHFHGKVTSEEVVAFLNRSDVLLHASVSEGIPTVVLEAMACAVPVVVSDCGGIREAVTDGVEGLVVRSRAPAELAEALKALADDPGLRERMGRAGRARVEAEFTIEQQVEAFASLYEQLIRDGASAGAEAALRGSTPRASA